MQYRYKYLRRTLHARFTNRLKSWIGCSCLFDASTMLTRRPQHASQAPTPMGHAALAGPDVDLDTVLSIRSYRYTVQHNAATRKGLA